MRQTSQALKHSNAKQGAIGVSNGAFRNVGLSMFRRGEFCWHQRILELVTVVKQWKKGGSSTAKYPVRASVRLEQARYCRGVADDVVSEMTRPVRSCSKRPTRGGSVIE